MKSITELQDEKKTLGERAKTFIEKAKNESRCMTADENKQYNECLTRMQEINLEIANREVENRAANFQPQKKEGFSFRRAFAAMANGMEMAETEREMNQRGRTMAVEGADNKKLYVPIQRAAFTSSTEAPKNILIDDKEQALLLPLLPRLVVSQAGANVMTGLKGNLHFAKYSGSNVFWEGENTKAKDGAGTFEKGKSFSPKRLTALVEFSKQLLMQENRDVEGFIRRTLADAIAQKVESTIFSKEAHAENVPDGLFKDGKPTDKGNMTWARIVDMETKADLANALGGNLAYIMNPKLLGKAKTLVKDASGAGGFVIGENGSGTLNGYKALRTTNIPDKLNTDEFGIVFGDWSQYFVGQWGSMEFLVDPYTKSDENMVRVVVTSYWDMGTIRDESFTISSMK